MFVRAGGVVERPRASLLKSCTRGSQRADSGLGFCLAKKRTPMTKSSKKRYTKPRITAQGSVDKITLEQNKGYGSTDGYLFQGNPIQNAS
jgi:hypothetical protein